jgi:hypothetical protein
MPTNYHFMADLANERVEERLRDGELHRAAKVDATSTPLHQSWLDRARCIILTAAAAVLSWSTRRSAITGC